MRDMTVREFIHNYENGKYDNPDVDTMIEAGWHDWFCEDDELHIRLEAMFPKVKQIAASSKIDIDTMFVFFKNNCPGRGDIYDDFRFCEMETGDVVFTITPATGHERNKGQAEVWGKENYFKGALVEGTWYDIINYFGIEVIHTMEYSNAEGDRRLIGKFGKSTQKQFDEALADLPKFIVQARQGNEKAGQTANDILWQLANESFSTRTFNRKTFETIHQFGKPEHAGVLV